MTSSGHFRVDDEVVGILKLKRSGIRKREGMRAEGRYEGLEQLVYEERISENTTQPGHPRHPLARNTANTHHHLHLMVLTILEPSIHEPTKTDADLRMT
jgi:hypothetical protein